MNVDGRVVVWLHKNGYDATHLRDQGLQRMADVSIFAKAQAALQKGFGKKAVFIREGGSIPFVTQMYDTFKVPCVLLGFGLPDENAHAPDEHIALENYFGGIKAIANFYSDLATL